MQVSVIPIAAHVQETVEAVLLSHAPDLRKQAIIGLCPVFADPVTKLLLHSKNCNLN